MEFEKPAETKSEEMVQEKKVNEENIGKTGEAAKRCSRCSNPIELFDIFCSACAGATTKGFRVLFVFQIVMFLAAAITLGLFKTTWIPAVYILQLLFFYWLWFIKKQSQFLATTLLFGAYLVLSLLELDADIQIVLFLPFYLTLAFIILAKRNSSAPDRFTRINMLWLVILLSYVSFNYAFKHMPGNNPYERYYASDTLSLISNALISYALWFALGGYILTLALDAVVKVVKEGVSVQKEYIKVRIEHVPTIDTVGKPMIVIPLIIVKGIVRKAAITFYNTLIMITNAIVRMFVFMYKLTIKFFMIVIAEFWRSVIFAFSFVFKCIRYAIIPAVAALLAAQAALKLSLLVTKYVYEPLWGTGIGILWNILMLILLCFVVTVTFARHDLVKMAACVFRDIAVILAYMLMLFPFISILLWIVEIALAKVFSEQVLPYGFGKFTFAGILVMIVAFVGIFYWQSKKKLQEAQRGIAE